MHINHARLSLLTLICCVTPVHAGFFDDLSNVVSTAKVVQNVTQAIQSDDNTASTSNEAVTNVEQPISVDLSKKSECTNDVTWGVFAGYDKPYSGVDKGVKYKTRGMLDYVSARGTSRCSLPKVNSPECLYFKVKKQAYVNAGGNKLTMQCFYEDAPDTLITDKSLYPHNVHYFKPEQLNTRCGNSKGIKGCMSGSDKVRAKKHLSNLKKYQAKDFSVCLPSGPKVREVFCQYVNPQTNRSLFKVAFTQKTK